MSWERDPLWAKSRLFFERAFNEPREESTFGLWSSLGLELLARAAIAAISPTLLAEPDREHKHLLHALNLGSERNPRKSIKASQVLYLCRQLLSPNFTDDDLELATALVNRRNEELHSGGAAFDEYPASQWLAGFYQVCNSLSVSMGENLESLFGPSEAKAATRVIQEKKNTIRKDVEILLNAHRKVFQGKSEAEKQIAREEADRNGIILSTQRHHRVSCPACECVATVQGDAVGKEHVTHTEDSIVVKQAVIPTSFFCSACGLTLKGYGQLEVAGLGGHYKRTTTCTPEEYYGLIDPSNIDEYLSEYMGDLDEYDNE